jgi:hypothetical protein
MITVWLWDTDGPDGRTQGVSATNEDARAAVEEELLSRRATFACVERARLILGAVQAYYELSGYSCTVRVESGRVVWTPCEAIEKRTA